MAGSGLAALIERTLAAVAAATPAPFELVKSEGAIQTVASHHLVTGPPDWEPVHRPARLGFALSSELPGRRITQLLNATSLSVELLPSAVRALEEMLVELRRGEELTAVDIATAALRRLALTERWGGGLRWDLFAGSRLGEERVERAFVCTQNTVRWRGGDPVVRIEEGWIFAANDLPARTAEADGAFVALALTLGPTLASAIVAANFALQSSLGSMPHTGEPIEIAIDECERALEEIALGVDRASGAG